MEPVVLARGVVATLIELPFDAVAGINELGLFAGPFASALLVTRIIEGCVTGAPTAATHGAVARACEIAVLRARRDPGWRTEPRRISSGQGRPSSSTAESLRRWRFSPRRTLPIFSAGRFKRRSVGGASHFLASRHGCPTVSAGRSSSASSPGVQKSAHTGAVRSRPGCSPLGRRCSRSRAGYATSSTHEHVKVIMSWLFTGSNGGRRDARDHRAQRCPR